MDPILALETTEKYGSIALLDGKTLLEEVLLPRDRRSAQTLAPAIDQLLRAYGIVPKEVAAVAVVNGPGSFTGLRVGVTTAKLFGYATGAGVDAFGTDFVVAEGFLVFQMPGLTEGKTDRPMTVLDKKELPPMLSVGVDAQRGEVCVRRFLRETVGLRFQYHAVTVSELMPVDRWWRQAEEYRDLCFTGPALERYAVKAPETIRLADESLWYPRAAVAGYMAAGILETGGCSSDCWSLVPVYSRLSAAEERLGGS